MYIILPILLAILALILNTTFIDLTYIIPLLLLWGYIGFLTFRPQESFVTLSISFGISFALHAFSSVISTILIYPFHPETSAFPYTAISLVTALIELLLTFFLFKIKRFKKGMPFLTSTSCANFATFICLFLYAFSIYTPANGVNHKFRVVKFLVFILSLAALIYWWQAQLTKSYKHALELRELESLRTELQEKDKLIQKLTKQNESLGKLIHKDNKLIPAMDNAVREYLATDFSDITSAHEKGTALLIEIEELSKNRTNIIAEIYQNKCKQHATGITALDTLLNYMEKRAYQDKVQFSVHIATELAQHIPSKISTDDLIHVLSDLLENALIATANSNTAHVQLQFYQSQKNFVVEVADTGIPFAIPSLVYLGLTQLTTHADTGGSGIGLMDIWEIKEKYRASLHITEYEANQPYTKKISLIFNKKNIYSITSCRHEEIAQQSKRNDLQLYKSKKN